MHIQPELERECKVAEDKIENDVQLSDTSAQAAQELESSTQARWKCIWISTKRRFSSYALPIVVLLAMLWVLIVCVALWPIHSARPFVVSIATALGAFLSPLPGLLKPEMQGRWSVAVIISAFVGLGGWFATKDLSDKIDSVQSEKNSLSERILTMQGSFKTLFQNESSQELDDASLQMGQIFRNQFVARRFPEIIDIADVMLGVRPENGHSLYYEGESYRVLANQTKKQVYRDEMVGRFNNFIAFSAHNLDSLTGDAAECYKRPSGYCQERVAWVNHELSNYYLKLANLHAGSTRVDDLYAALNYEKSDVDLRSIGFYGNGTMKSSCSVLREIRLDLLSAGRNISTVENEIQKLKTPC